jgi:molybdopterin adenylyltransferase
MADLRIGIVTASDSCHAGDRVDTAGAALGGMARERGWSVVGALVCPDDREALETALAALSDIDGADVVFTTGGTGLGPRDNTPEATAAVCDRLAPGIAEHLRAESAKVTGRAMLSRGVAGIRGRTLIINLPGSEKAVRETFGFVADQLEHAVEMMSGGGH